jgi:hypothetical protein
MFPAVNRLATRVLNQLECLPPNHSLGLPLNQRGFRQVSPLLILLLSRQDCQQMFPAVNRLATRVLNQPECLLLNHSQGLPLNQRGFRQVSPLLILLLSRQDFQQVVQAVNRLATRVLNPQECLLLNHSLGLPLSRRTFRQVNHMLNPLLSPQGGQ